MLLDYTSTTEQRMPKADYQEAAHHERQVRSMTRVMFPMMDIASLVECTPEANRRRTAEHERFAQSMEGHVADAAETLQGVIIRVAGWVERYLTDVLGQCESSETAGKH